MPKITIKTLPLNESINIPQVLKILGDDLADSLDICQSQIVILWEQILANQFLFNGQLTDVQEKSTHHPIVEVTYVEGMPGQLEKKMVHSLVKILSYELKIDSNNICVVLNTLKPGNLFVSGKFKKESAGA
jgi:phenylpyruvate tautomerase PptA (4-oxalocrotonate tautomerase family)